MKIVDNLLEKLGTDKILHFLGGGFLCSLLTIFSLLLMNTINWDTTIKSISIGTTFVFVISIIKEIADDKFDWKDIIAAILGCIIVYIIAIIGLIF